MYAEMTFNFPCPYQNGWETVFFFTFSPMKDFSSKTPQKFSPPSGANLTDFYTNLHFPFSLARRRPFFALLCSKKSILGFSMRFFLYRWRNFKQSCHRKRVFFSIDAPKPHSSFMSEIPHEGFFKNPLWEHSWPEIPHEGFFKKSFVQE